MMVQRQLVILLVVNLLVCMQSLWSQGNAPGPEHPFLLLQRTDFPALRQRAARDPWKRLGQAAIATAKAPIRLTGNERSDWWIYLEYVGAVPLAYILEPGSARVHAQRVRDSILNHYDRLKFTAGHSRTVTRRSCAVISIVALDVVYDSLNANEIASCEAKIQTMLKGSGWPPSVEGSNGVWEVYQSGNAAPDDKYLSQCLDQVTADGVHVAGSTYGNDRFATAWRYCKWLYAHVLEHTGGDRRYYSNKALRGGCEWTTGYSVNPAGMRIPFGDTKFSTRRYRTMEEGHVGFVRYSTNAFKYALHHLDLSTLKGTLPAYLFLPETLPEATMPPSRIFPDGGAYFIERSPERTAFMAAMLNVGKSMFHTKKETNAVYMAAYGEHLLCGNGWMTKEGRSNRFSSTFDFGNGHAKRIGAGIVEGFVGGALEYARGDAGAALPDGKHHRSLVMVHPDGSSGGYAVIYDEGKSSTGQAVTYLHPNTLPGRITTTKAREAYEAPINAFDTGSNRSLALSIYYATQPESVEFLEHKINDDTRMPYLKAAYRYAPDATTRIITVLFPHDSSHPKPNMNRIAIPNGSGVSLSSARHTDIAATSLAGGPWSYGNVTVQAPMALYRTEGSSIKFYFVTQGRAFRDSEARRVGFESDEPISVFMHGSEGNVVGETSRARFYLPGISGLEVDGTVPGGLRVGTGWAEAPLGSGAHQVVLISGSATPRISIDAVTVTEGDSGPVNADFTVSLSQASSETITVNYATAGNTATSGTDFTADSGTLTFAPGETTKTVTVYVQGDTVVENNETYYVNLSNAANATINVNQGLGTIVDDDGDTPRLSIDDITVTEGNTGTQTGTFTVTLDKASVSTITVDYVTGGGNATAGTDYMSVAPATLTFNPGDTSKAIIVTILGDTSEESNETFKVTLSNPVNAAISDDTGVCTIMDDDGETTGGGDGVVGHRGCGAAGSVSLTSFMPMLALLLSMCVTSFRRRCRNS